MNQAVRKKAEKNLKKFLTKPNECGILSKSPVRAARYPTGRTDERAEKS